MPAFSAIVNVSARSSSSADSDPTSFHGVNAGVVLLFFFVALAILVIGGALVRVAMSVVMLARRTFLGRHDDDGGNAMPFWVSIKDVVLTLLKRGQEQTSPHGVQEGRGQGGSSWPMLSFITITDGARLTTDQRVSLYLNSRGYMNAPEQRYEVQVQVSDSASAVDTRAGFDSDSTLVGGAPNGHGVENETRQERDREQRQGQGREPEDAQAHGFASESESVAMPPAAMVRPPSYDETQAQHHHRH